MPAPDPAAAAAGWSLKASAAVPLADAGLLADFSLPPPSALPPQLAGAQACRLLFRCDACRVSAASGLALSLSLPRVYQSLVLTLSAREAFPQCAPRARAAFVAAPPGDAPLSGAVVDVRISPVAFAYSGTSTSTGVASSSGSSSSAGSSGAGAAQALQAVAAAGGSSSGFDLSIMNAKAITSASTRTASVSGVDAGGSGSSLGSVPPSLLLSPDADTLLLSLSFTPTGSASVLLASDAIDPLAVITTIVGFVSGLAGGFAVAMRVSERARGKLGQTAVVRRCARSQLCSGCRRAPGAIPLSSHSARRGKAGWQQQAEALAGKRMGAGEGMAGGAGGGTGSVLAHEFEMTSALHGSTPGPGPGLGPLQGSSSSSHVESCSFAPGAVAGSGTAAASASSLSQAGSRGSVQLVSGVNLMAPSASTRRLATAQADAAIAAHRDASAAAAAAADGVRAPSRAQIAKDHRVDDRHSDRADHDHDEVIADPDSASEPDADAVSQSQSVLGSDSLEGSGSDWATNRRSRVSSITIAAAAAAASSAATAAAGARSSFIATAVLPFQGAAQGAAPAAVRQFHFPRQLEPSVVRNPLSSAASSTSAAVSSEQGHT